MRFNDQFIEELKSRLRPSDVIGRTVKLKRQGREYVGLSPFSKEKSPSFFVNDDKGFFHDFSSGKHGDIISFLQETERLSFVEAIERLAGEAGMALPEPDAQSAQQEKVRSSLTDWMDLAARWFEAELRRPPGADARAYLERRGLPASEWERFHIGLAPANRTGLKDYLIAKGARPGELVEAGLLIAPEDGGAPYDRFRDRIIFPITDARGRIVSFGGRALDPNAKAKYLNGPDTVLFDKSRTLYGLFEARKILHSKPAAEQGELVVVEGYMDVIACHRAGIAAAAPMGTALTEGQMELLWRLHNEPTLCFDGDAAGRRAAGRTIDRALPVLKPGRSFKFAVITGGKDPDEVLREKGAGALKDQLSQTTPRSRRCSRASATSNRSIRPSARRRSRAGCAPCRPRSPTRIWPAPIATICWAASTSCSQPTARPGSRRPANRAAAVALRAPTSPSRRRPRASPPPAAWPCPSRASPPPWPRRRSTIRIASTTISRRWSGMVLAMRRSISSPPRWFACGLPPIHLTPTPFNAICAEVDMTRC